MATKEHCFHCFAALESTLSSTQIPSVKFDGEFPLFVTWKIDGELRGCIGTFSPLPLDSGLERFALQSALNDTRFSPITMKEFKLLACSVSLLIDFEQASAWNDWIVGTHGIKIKYGEYSATYLPEVAHEQGPALLKKAGII